MLDRRKWNQARNDLLRLIGLRWIDSIQVSDPEQDDYRVVYQATFENRPWWRHAHVVEKEQTAELIPSEARKLQRLRQSFGTLSPSERRLVRVIDQIQNYQ